jgi:hypothetical protein
LSPDIRVSKVNHYQYTEKLYQLFIGVEKAREYRSLDLVSGFLAHQLQLHPTTDKTTKQKKASPGNRLFGKLHESNALLPPSSQYFLATLLYRADLRGVVSGINKDDLARLAGMSKDRVHTQLKRLKEAGVIKSSVQGVTVKAPIGKLTTIYMLNIQHPCLGAGGVPVRRITATDKVVTDYNFMQFWHRLATAYGFWRSNRAKWEKRHKDRLARSSTSRGIAINNRVYDLVSDYPGEFTAIELDLQDLAMISGEKRIAERVQAELEEIAAQLLGGNLRSLKIISEKRIWFYKILHDKTGLCRVPYPEEIEKEDVFILAFEKVASGLFAQLEIKRSKSAPNTGRLDEIFNLDSNLDNKLLNLVRYLALEAVYLGLVLEGVVASAIAGRRAKYFVLIHPLESKEGAFKRTLDVYPGRLESELLTMERSVHTDMRWMLVDNRGLQRGLPGGLKQNTPKLLK